MGLCGNNRNRKSRFLWFLQFLGLNERNQKNEKNEIDIFMVRARGVSFIGKRGVSYEKGSFF